MIVQKTLSMQATNGYSIAFDPNNLTPFSSVTIRADQACYVQTVPYSAGMVMPAKPAGTPAPGAGSTADWYHAKANEVFTLGQELPRGGEGKFCDLIAGLLVWCEATGGDLVMDAH